MGLHNTIPMSTLRDIKVLHLEPTDVCQAACPLCARELDVNFDKNTKHHLTIEQIKSKFSDDQLKNLDKVFLCGSYGDPAAGKHTLDIYRYFRKLNPAITLGMNTNGALQTTEWWQELGNLLSSLKDYCVFSIDGLQDTNHIYRKNVNWNQLMRNVNAFIAAGGNAHWDMLVYRHNQHQVEKCKKLAKDMGFKWFRSKVSTRGFTTELNPPSNWQLVQFTGRIQCLALKEKSMYIDAQGRASPCCWLGSRSHSFVEDDLASVSLTWETKNPNPVCKSVCSTNNKHTIFENQWQKNIDLFNSSSDYDN